MIRNDNEYRKVLDRIEAEKDRLKAQREHLEATRLTPLQIKNALDPFLSFHLQLVEEAEAYQRLQRGEFEDLTDLQGVGRLLISLRLFRGISQRELAVRLGVHESQVSRDERNEYHGITLSRAARILRVLGARVASSVELVDPPEKESISL